MRVLLIDTVSGMGGAQWSLLELATRFVRQGIKTCAAVPEGPLADRLRAAGVEIYITPVFRPHRKALILGVSRSSYASLRLGWRLWRIARACKAEVLYANSLSGAYVASYLPLSRPLIWHVRDLRFPRNPVLRVTNRARRMIAASQAIDELLCDQLPRECLSRIRLVVNGVDTKRFVPADRTAARQALGLPAGVPVVGMLAHLVPWKRHDVFLQVAERVKARYPEARFILAGEDLFREHAAWVSRLRAQAQKAKLESSLLWLDRVEDSSRVIAALDVLVHPPADEPFGRVLCEAMAMEVPVVAVDKAGPAGIVADCETGLLAARPAPEELAAKALELLGDPARAVRMGTSGRRRVLAQFDADRTATEAAAVCRDALDEHHAEHPRA